MRRSKTVGRFRDALIRAAKFQAATNAEVSRGFSTPRDKYIPTKTTHRLRTRTRTPLDTIPEVDDEANTTPLKYHEYSNMVYAIRHFQKKNPEKLDIKQQIESIKQFEEKTLMPFYYKLKDEEIENPTLGDILKYHKELEFNEIFKDEAEMPKLAFSTYIRTVRQMHHADMKYLEKKLKKSSITSCKESENFKRVVGFSL